MITYKKQPFGCYLIEEVGLPENNRLVQVDMEFPTLAQTFGGRIHWDDIEGATKFLDDNEGKQAEDPGWLDVGTVADSYAVKLCSQ